MRCLVTFRHGVKIPILELLVSSLLKPVLCRMKAIIVVTMHSTSFSQVEFREEDCADGLFHSVKEVGNNA